MARSLASPIAATLALLACAPSTMAMQANAATQVQQEPPPLIARWRAAVTPADMTPAVTIGLPPATPPTYTFIIGGNPAGDTPWQVQLYSTYTYTESDFQADDALPDTHLKKFFLRQMPAWERAHRCGGAYIGDMWMLTAAHCVASVPTDKIFTLRRVRAGTRDLTSGGTTFRVERVVIHKHYVGVGTGRLFDIALVRIEADAGTDATAASYMKPIRILGSQPGDRPLSNYDTVRVTGWGFTDPRAPLAPKLRPDGSLMHLSAELMEVDLKRLPESVCNGVPGFLGLTGSSVICAGSSDPAKDSCQGDSGGPLTRVESPTETVLVGLVSLGKGCAYANTPGIYSSAVFFRNWISTAKQQSVAGKVSRL